MKRQNKFGAYEKGVIITGVAVLIIFLILLTADGIKNIGKNNKPIALSEQEEVVPPNAPTLSAGMIPVKYNGDNLIICKNDNTWYNYEAGTPAYMMLNDGVYQSELTVDMPTDDNLASKNIGKPVPTEEQGTIYMWIPRFEINGEDQIKYVKEVNYASDGYEIPEMFTYKQTTETSPDFLLTGIWIEKTPLASTSAVTTKITNMIGENNTYGFIANTIPVNAGDCPMTAESWSTGTVPDNNANDVGAQAMHNEAVTRDARTATIICARMDDLSNPNRTVLKIINDKHIDPIKAKVEYNKTTGLIETTITYSKYGINKITLEDTTELPMANTNGIITANTEGIALEPGTYEIKITDKNGTTKRLKAIVPLEYGREVLGYECEVQGVKWRLFHADDNNIYLIADDYIPYANLPTSTNGNTLNKGDTDYKAYFNNILNDYTGSSWIKENTNSKAQKWLSKYLTEYPSSTNNNIKAVAYMMDTDSWSGFAGDNAEYAIGGPTIELFCVSYKETHPDIYIECDNININGYQVKWSNGSYEDYISGLKKDEYNSIYIKSDTTRAEGMWLASPSIRNANYDIYVRYTGFVNTPNYVDTNLGFRPVVCLKSGVGLLDNGDNTYSIKELIMANIEYKEADGTIEITVRYTENGIAKIEDKNGKVISFTNENGKIKAVVPAVGGRNKFTITDNKGNTKELEVSVVLPIYATLYKDNTDVTNIILAFTATDRVLEGKTVINSYGDISSNGSSMMPWYSQRENITTVDIVDKIYPKSTAYWFSNFRSLTKVENISNLDTSCVTNMGAMFQYCDNLTQVDITNFDTSSVTSMYSMFEDCKSLSKLDVSNFDTSNVIYMYSMFDDCSSLTNLDLNNFDTRNVTDMNAMFCRCSSLKELNISSFNTKNTINMGNMFFGSTELTELDLSSFDTNNVTNMFQMFRDCTNLKTIYVGENWKLAPNTTAMFNGCGTSTTTNK